jgi:transposase
VNDRDTRDIIREITRHPLQSVKELVISYNLSKPEPNKISLSTCEKILIKNQLISRRLQTKWKISPKNVKIRLSWAKEHLGWIRTQWDKVVYSDESSVQNQAGLKLIRIRRGSDIPPQHYVQKNKWDLKIMVKWDLKIMVWGFITANGVRGIKFMEENITGESYRKMLEGTLYNELPGLFNQELVFQQDNAPAHNERSVKEYFESNDIDILHWPPQSPDLNIIEDCWRYLKRRLKNNYEQERELRQDILTIWNTMPEEFITKLYRSIPQRLREVIKSKGGPTKY